MKVVCKISFVFFMLLITLSLKADTQDPYVYYVVPVKTSKLYEVIEPTPLEKPPINKEYVIVDRSKYIYENDLTNGNKTTQPQYRFKEKYIVVQRKAPLYYVPLRKYYAFEPANNDVSFLKNESIIYTRDPQYRLLTYSSVDPRGFMPIRTDKLFISDKFGTPLLITGIDRQGRRFVERADSEKRWYLCDSCNHGYSRLIKMGPDFYICKYCYEKGQIDKTARDRWLAIHYMTDER